MWVLAEIFLPAPKKKQWWHLSIKGVYSSCSGKPPSRHGGLPTRLGFIKILQRHHCGDQPVMTTRALKHHYIFCATISEVLFIIAIEPNMASAKHWRRLYFCRQILEVLIWKSI